MELSMNVFLRFHFRFLINYSVVVLYLNLLFNFHNLHYSRNMVWRIIMYDVSYDIKWCFISAFGRRHFPDWTFQISARRRTFRNATSGRGWHWAPLSSLRAGSSERGSSGILNYRKVEWTISNGGFCTGRGCFMLSSFIVHTSKNKCPMSWTINYLVKY